MPKRHAKHQKFKAPSHIATPAIAPVTPPRPERKRIRLSSGLLGLSSVAIVAVYSIGYVHTMHANEPGAGPAAVLAAAPAPAAPALPSYRDGTYVGLGTSRHGNIEATVVIQNGRVVSAAVSRCSTRYSCSEVNPLVREVIANQGTPVDQVSGATDSSHAYKQAVANALTNAT
jgi:uncharacterized protein with FMN-binding domain